MIDKTVCELFAGVGGFRLGLERSSNEWQTVWANQWEPGRKNQFAFDCYCSHFGRTDNHVNKDISSIDKSSIPDHNLLVGGFPCQDYSVARTGASGIQGKKGVLWWDIRDILDKKRPRFVLLENVDRLLKSPSSQRGRDFGIILTCFKQLEYNVEWRVINAADYGLPQRRRRTFIFAYHNTTKYSKDMHRLNPASIINTYGFFAKSFPIENIININSTELSSNTNNNLLNDEELTEISSNFMFSFENSGYMSNNKIYTCKTAPLYTGPRRTLSDVLQYQNVVDDKYYLGVDLSKWEYLKGAKKIERTSKTGHKYTFSEGPIAFPDPIDRPSRTMLTSESSLNRSTHVICDPITHRYRLITPIEAERLQGFDDNWTNTGMTDKNRYFCMGNALVVGLIEIMGNQLNQIFNKEPCSQSISNSEIL